MDTIETQAKPARRGADKKEAFHREAESRREPFSFKRPDVPIEGRRGVFYLGSSDIIRGQIQVIPEGGDTDLHYHPGADTIWFVLQGKVRFYDSEGVLGEYGQHEGLLMPRNSRYWFETADTSEELHLMQVSANIKPAPKNGFVAVNGRQQREKKALRFNYPPGARIPNS